MAAVGSDRVEAERLRLYAYATAPEASSYVAIMRLFVGALLAEWSAHDLVGRGLDLPVEAIDQRLRYLEEHGNLLASPREVRVTSIADYQRQPARYTATSLGVRVHRQVEEVLAAAGAPGRCPASCWPPSPTGSRRWPGCRRPSSPPPTRPAWPRRSRRCSCSSRPSLARSPTSTATSARCSPVPTSTTRNGSGSSTCCSTTWRQSSRASPATPSPSGWRSTAWNATSSWWSSAPQPPTLRSRPCVPPAREARASSGRGATRSTTGRSCGPGSGRRATGRPAPSSSGPPRCVRSGRCWPTSSG